MLVVDRAFLREHPPSLMFSDQSLPVRGTSEAAVPASIPVEVPTKPMVSLWLSYELRDILNFSSSQHDLTMGLTAS